MVDPEDKEPAPGAAGELPPDRGESPAQASPPAAQPPPSYEYYDDPYADSEGVDSTASGPGSAAATTVEPQALQDSGSGAAPPVGGAGAGPPGDEPPDEDEEGMLRMSFFDHLAELRRRILYALGGLFVAFGLSLLFANRLWSIVSRPAVSALRQLGVDPPVLAQISPMEYFNVVWLKLPLLSAVFLASPWLLYQIWAFIAPGLYRKERRWAAPFVISTAGLFILGGVFAYFVVFRFALVFLLGLGIGNNVRPLVSVDSYFSIFVNVMLGVGVVFELPVLIFFLTLIRVLTPGFLIRNVRYAILAIFVLAAIITPTPDVFNLVLFALPMCVLFFVGIGASYLLVLHREHRQFPWSKVLSYLGGLLAVVALVMYYLHARFGYQFVSRFPWFGRP